MQDGIYFKQIKEINPLCIVKVGGLNQSVSSRRESFILRKSAVMEQAGLSGSCFTSFPLSVAIQEDMVVSQNSTGCYEKVAVSKHSSYRICC